jgi:Tol biopolymer transport system component
MTQRLTPETLIYGLKSAGDPQLSPDGDWVVYTLSSVSPDTNKETTHLWLQGREDGHAQQLTNHYDSNSGPCWSPDGRWLAFVASDGDRSGIMLLPFGQPGEPRPSHL